MHDETDMEVEPRRREHVGRRGYSPRRTQSSSTRVEMYFPEVDVDVKHPRPREPTASLTNIRSSDDISSGYSSGEALQSTRSAHGDSLVRTSSVGARTRAKPRSTTKKTPEDAGEDSDSNDPPSSKNISLPSPLSHVTPEQALEILLLLSQNSNVADYVDFHRASFVAGNDDLVGNTSQSGPKPERNESDSGESIGDRSDSALMAEVQIVQSIETNIVPETLTKSQMVDDTTAASVDPMQPKETNVLEVKIEETVISNVAKDSTVIQAPSGPSENLTNEADRTVTDELCQSKFDELKQLLSEAHKAVNNIVHTQETLRLSDISITDTLSETENARTEDANENLNREELAEDKELPKEAEEVQVTIATKTDLETDNAGSSDIWTTPNMSRSDSGSIARAGKYNKKPAPKAPLATSEDDFDDADDSQNALKATLVIKTGTLKSFSNTSSTKDVFISHAVEKPKGKKSKRQRTKEGFSKLLTIPKNIFQSAFNREHRGSMKAEDSASDISATESRSNSSEPQEMIVELAPKLSISSQERSDDRSDDTSSSSDTYVIAPSNNTDDTHEIEKEKDVETANESKVETVTLKSEIREMSQSPKVGRKLESDIY